jgi:hypothetical protein
MKMSRKILYVLCLFVMWLPLSLLNAEKPTVHRYSFTDLFTVGVYEPKNEKEEPYQFFTIASISCDTNGNIFVFDYQAQQVKRFDPNGVFVRKYFSKGAGPKQISNAFDISINNYSGHIFVLQDYGYVLKEFDSDGNDIKRYLLPRQFYSSFQFLNNNEFLCINTVPKMDQFNNFLIIDVSQKKVVKEFASTDMAAMNDRQNFAIQGGKRLWTCMGNEMKLKAYDMETGNKVEEISIPGNFKENTKLVTMSGEFKYTMPIIYNTAQPFIIDDQLFVLLIFNDYKNKDGKPEKYPFNCQRIIYQVIGNRFEKLGSLKEGEEFHYATVYKNRLILYANDPYGRFKVLEFK